MIWFLLPPALLILAAVPLALLVAWSRIRALERRLAGLERSLAGLRAELRPPPGGTPAPVAREPAPALPTPAPAPTPSPAPPSSPAAVTPPPSAPHRGRGGWEALVGGKLLNRVGALALVLGVAFFLRYAFEKDWIPEAGRVLLGAAAGAVCLAAARRAGARSYAVFAQGLTGAGIAVLYLAAYASFGTYGLVPQVAAFVLMSLVTLTGFLEAHRTGSLAVAVLAWAGGTLTPLLLSTGEPNATGLFTYTALLTAGILALVVLREDWFLLHPLSLAGAYLLAAAWILTSYVEAQFPVTFFFLLIFWGLFAAVEVAQIVQMSPRLGLLKQVLAGANTLFLVLLLRRLFASSPHDLFAPVLLLLGGVYLFQRAGLAERLSAVPGAAARLEVTAALLLALATDVQFERFTVVVLWSLEAFVIALAAAGRGSAPLRGVAYGLLGAAVLRFLAIRGTFGPAGAEAVWPLLNDRALAGAVLGAVLIRVAALGDAGSPLRTAVVRLLEGAAVVVLTVLVTVEVGDALAHLKGAAWISSSRLEYLTLAAMPVAWMVLALLFLKAGLRRRPSAFAPLALLLAAAACAVGAGLGFSYGPLPEFRPVVNERAVMVLLLMAGAWSAGRQLAADTAIPPRQAWFTAAAAVAAVVLAFVGVTGEIRDFFGRMLADLPGTGEGDHGVRSMLEDQKQLAISGAWVLFSVALMGLGIARRRRIDRVLAFVLFGITILKIFLYDLSFLDTLYRIFSFAGLGLVLLGVSWLYQRYKDRIFGAG